MGMVNAGLGCETLLRTRYAVYSTYDKTPPSPSISIYLSSIGEGRILTPSLSRPPPLGRR